MINTLFSSVWTERYRPKTMDDIVLGKENKTFISELSRKGEIPNLMLASSPGTGKSSIAKIIVNSILDCQYLYINASEENGINDIRSKVMTFAQTMSIDSKIKVVILDECDYLSINAQAALRNVMEEFLGTTRFILTCNYPLKVIPALHSRCQELDMTPPFEGVVARCIHILKAEGVTVPEQTKPQLVQLIKNAYPDVRKCINRLQKSVIDNVLIISETNNAVEFAEEVLSLLMQKKKDLMEIRKIIIDNETNFNNDYHDLLRSLFDCVYNSNIAPDKKRMAMLAVSEGMYRHSQVLDQEINAFSCVLTLSEII